MSDIKLLPCPFCGGEAELQKVDIRDIHGHKIGIEYEVTCKDDNCDCLMSPRTPIYRKPEEAIRKWNTRKPMVTKNTY